MSRNLAPPCPLAELPTEPLFQPPRLHIGGNLVWLLVFFALVFGLLGIERTMRPGTTREIVGFLPYIVITAFAVFMNWRRWWLGQFQQSFNAAMAQLRSGDATGARETLQTIARRFRRMPFAHILSLDGLAIASLYSGDLQRAEALFSAVLAYPGVTASKAGYTEAAELLALCYSLQGKTEQASCWLEQLGAGSVLALLPRMIVLSRTGRSNEAARLLDGDFDSNVALLDELHGTALRLVGSFVAETSGVPTRAKTVQNLRDARPDRYRVFGQLWPEFGAFLQRGGSKDGQAGLPSVVTQ